MTGSGNGGGNGGEVGPFIDPDEMRRGLVAVQLDDVRKEDLVRKGNRIRKGCSIWTFIDLKQWMNVTVF